MEPPRSGLFVVLLGLGPTCRVFYRSFYRVRDRRGPKGGVDDEGYVTRKGNRWYAVVYEGIDPETGRERRSWHAAGTDRADAERLAARLAAERNGRNGDARSLSFGAYLTRRWLESTRRASGS